MHATGSATSPSTWASSTASNDASTKGSAHASAACIEAFGRPAVVQSFPPSDSRCASHAMGSDTTSISDATTVT